MQLTDYDEFPVPGNFFLFQTLLWEEICYLVNEIFFWRDHMNIKEIAEKRHREFRLRIPQCDDVRRIPEGGLHPEIAARRIALRCELRGKRQAGEYEQQNREKFFHDGVPS